MLAPVWNHTHHSVKALLEWQEWRFGWPQRSWLHQMSSATLVESRRIEKVYDSFWVDVEAAAKERGWSVAHAKPMRLDMERAASEV